jgi:hypothetical protein
MAVRLSALRVGRRSPPKKHYFSFSDTHFWINLRAGRIGKLITIIHVISLSHYATACNYECYHIEQWIVEFLAGQQACASDSSHSVQLDLLDSKYFITRCIARSMLLLAPQYCLQSDVTFDTALSTRTNAVDDRSDSSKSCASIRALVMWH